MTLCLPPDFVHDERLHVILRAAETRDFLRLLAFQMERPNPTEVKPSRLANLRIKLGMTGKSGQEKWQRRLERWASPGIELVAVDDDGGLLITYLLEQESDTPRSQPTAQPSPASVNGSGPLRQNRTYSTSPAAQREREKYWARQRAENGLGEAAAGAENQENLSARESKPLQNGAGFSAESGPKSDTEKAQVSSRTPEDVNVNTYLPEIAMQSSPDTLNVAAAETLQKTCALPIPRNLRVQDVPLVKQTAVQNAMRGTEAKAAYKSRWLSLWQHCYETGTLETCWNKGFLLLAQALHSRPLTGPKAIQHKAPWADGTIRALLDQAGHPYEAQAIDGPTDPAEIAAIQSDIAQMRQQWGQKDAQAHPSPGAVPTAVR